MNENKLWEKFCENGRVADYLAYRQVVNKANIPCVQSKTELKTLDENNSTGLGYKRTEYR